METLWKTQPHSAAEAERRRSRDAFLMDFENYVLRFWYAYRGIPTGKTRFENENWAALMKSHLEFSDTCWDEYVAWVQQGGGDEWFQEEE